jgi:hypothetical protein
MWELMLKAPQAFLVMKKFLNQVLRLTWSTNHILKLRHFIFGLFSITSDPNNQYKDYYKQEPQSNTTPKR